MKKTRHKRLPNLLFHFIVQIGKTNGVRHQEHGYFWGEGNNDWKGPKSECFCSADSILFLYLYTFTWIFYDVITIH